MTGRFDVDDFKLQSQIRGIQHSEARLIMPTKSQDGFNTAY